MRYEKERFMEPVFMKRLFCISGTKELSMEDMGRVRIPFYNEIIK